MRWMLLATLGLAGCLDRAAIADDADRTVDAATDSRSEYEQSLLGTWRRSVRGGTVVHTTAVTFAEDHTGSITMMIEQTVCGATKTGESPVRWHAVRDGIIEVTSTRCAIRTTGTSTDCNAYGTPCPTIGTLSALVVGDTLRMGPQPLTAEEFDRVRE